MHEIVTTTGRKMTASLQDAIDGLPNRELVIKAFSERGEKGGAMGDLYAALALEVRLAALRDEDYFRRLAQERQDEMPEPPLPEATGPAVCMDPDTGEITELEG